MISYPSAVLVGYDNNTSSKWTWEKLLRGFEGFVWSLSITVCPILMPVLFQSLLSVLHTRKPHPLQLTVTRRVFCPPWQKTLRVSLSPGFVSCGISGRGRVERCFGQECLPALFFSCNGWILTQWSHWGLAQLIAAPMSHRPASADTSPSAIRKQLVVTEAEIGEYKKYSAMTVLPFYLVISLINLFKKSLISWQHKWGEACFI